ncbi:MAG TPA: 8-oxoguanine deaminase [Lentisphaeria bacterium]|nr:MAG: 8-oxoguanine deaminase [Lentisphaerae bacterium GWF2_38_69]HBM16861.1 8-oxoguanine deaminase [Lentisphaeria bacterium]
MAVFIKNIQTLVTMDENFTVLSGVDVKIEGNKIAEIGKNLSISEAAKIIDGSNKVVYPGFINTHHHFYQTLTRNIPAIQSVKLFDWLVLLYEIWTELNEEFVELSTKIAVGELLLSGCTTSTDHYYVFPKGKPNELLDIEIDIARKMGMRFYPCRGSMTRGRSNGGLPPDTVVQSPEEIMKDCDRIIKKYHSTDPFAMTRIILAPCSPFSVTTDILKDTSKYARNKGVMMHTHLCETKDEEDYCLKMHGKRPLEYMNGCGWLGNDVFFAHGIHFNDEEIKVLAKTQTGIAHCPASNMRLGSGICRVPDLLDAGVKVGLAVDGSASNDAGNYVREIQLALLINRIGSSEERMTPQKALYIATNGGAKVFNNQNIGSIKVGQAADLAIFNLERLDFAGAMSDPMSAIVFCGAGMRTDFTIVNGKVVVENGRLVGIDEKEIFHRANAFTKKILEKTSARTKIDYYKYKSNF